MNIRKNLTALGLTGILTATSLIGCARFSDSWSSRGSLVGSTKSPYIVVNQSGGKIMDVYKLEKAIVQSPSSSDGWLFLDEGDRPVYLGGDVKTIRLKSTGDDIWEKYHEYHMEFETQTYREKFGESGK